MSILYSTIDKRYWLYQPQLTRWRHPYRGVRHSEKVNQEIGQIHYDMSRLGLRSKDLNVTIKDLVDKSYNGFDYSGSLISNNLDTDMIGITDLSIQVEILRNRIRGLE